MAAVSHSLVALPLWRRLVRSEVLYRQRLQVERDLLRAGTIEPPKEPGVVERVIEKVTGLVG